jgi:ketosteroid isomerase-like protein
MSEDTKANKRMAIALLEASAKHDGKRFDELLHPEATYWVIGKPHLFSYGGEQTREQIVAYMSSPTIFINGGVETKFGDITAEGDRVAVEAETKGTLPDGRVYTNVYHYLIKIPRTGRSFRVKEYLGHAVGGPSVFAKK